jgi:hypothetical protein
MTPVKRVAVVWLAIVSCVTGLPEDAGQAAVRFIEMARSGELDLEPGRDTAMLPETSAEKRKQIARRLQRLKTDIGDDPLELGEMRVDGGFAAAVVRAASGFDPSRIRVFAIGLVKRDDRWLPAPVPGSFENTGAAYTADNRRRLEALRDWMLREQALDIERIKDGMADRLRQEIARKLPASELQAMDSEDAARRFIEACGQRDLPALLGLLGGLSQDRPDDWPQRLHSAQAALAGDSVSRQWELLAGKDVLRAVLDHNEEQDSATVTIGCLDPAANAGGMQDPQIELIVLPFSKSPDGMWQCDPPADFHQPANAWDNSALPSGDSALLDSFVEKIRRIHPPQPQAEARGLLDSLLGSLAARNLPAMLRLLTPPGDDKPAARESLIRAAHVWWSLANPENPFLAIKPLLGVEGGNAAAVCHFFSPRNPERPELRVFYFEKSPDGWCWLPSPGENAKQAMDRWVRDQSAELRETWRDRLLADCVLLEKLPETAIPDAGAADDVVRSWLNATRAGDLEAALRCTARLAAWDSAESVLRILGYEVAGNRKSTPVPIILHNKRAGIWTAVGVRATAGDDPSFPLYPVIQTADGPRILIEVDLFAAVKRSRDFLNKNALARLEGQPQQYADDLLELLREHEKLIATPAR